MFFMGIKVDTVNWLGYDTKENVREIPTFLTLNYSTKIIKQGHQN